MRNKHQIIEEPCEIKVSCTVLKTNGAGDSLVEFNRSCHDAIGAIFIAIRLKPKYVLDADIAKCFDRINHDALLRKLNTFPTIRRQIRAWLKAGVIDWSTESNKQSSYTPTSEGTPQGGVLSPLLANIALHGMENRIKQYAETLPTRAGYGKKVNRGSLSLIRYADDFVSATRCRML